MTFLDSSVIIDMLEGVDETVTYVESRGTPYLTSLICVYEVFAVTLGRWRDERARGAQAEQQERRKVDWL